VTVRILHLRNTCGYFGAERCIVSWIETLSLRGHAFDLAVFEHPDASSEEFLAAVDRAGARVTRLPREQTRALAAFSTLSKLVRSRRPDLLHAHENRSAAYGLVIGRLTRTPVVATLHGYVSTNAKTKRWNAVNRRLLSGPSFAAVTVPTLELRERLGPRVELVPNAASEELASATRIPRDRTSPPAFGVIARLSREKGVDVFLDAVAKLPRAFRFEIIGEGPEGAALRRHAAAERVSWLGYRGDAVEKMRHWDALVIPSRSEGLPIVLLEAMAQGVPIVATRAGGIVDAIDAGAHGLLTGVEDAEGLARAMLAIVQDPEGAGVRAAAARARFLERYTLRRIADQLEAIYARAAGSTR